MNMWKNKQWPITSDSMLPLCSNSERMLPRLLREGALYLYLVIIYSDFTTAMRNITPCAEFPRPPLPENEFLRALKMCSFFFRIPHIVDLATP
jgi:hypothetical protein